MWVGPRHHELVYDCVLNRGWGEFGAVVADVLPLLESVATVDDPFLEGLIGLLELPQLLLLLSLAHQRSISLMLTLLVVNRLKVAILRSPLLHIELLLELKVHDVRVHLDHVVPELLLLAVGLLDLADGHV